MDIKTYLNNVCKEIKYEPAKKAISEELELHIKEVKENHINDGIDEKLAEEKAVNQMGSAEEIGKSLNKIHKPQLDWKLLILIGILMGFSLYISILKEATGNDTYLISTISYMIIGFVISIVIYLSDYRKLKKHSLLLYVLASIILLWTTTNYGGTRIQGVLCINFFGYSFFPGTITVTLYIIAFIGFIVGYDKNNAIKFKIQDEKFSINMDFLKIVGLTLLSLIIMQTISTWTNTIILSFVYLAITTIKIITTEENRIKNLLKLYGIIGILVIILMIGLDVNPFDSMRVLASFNPEIDPEGRGYIGMLQKEILQNAKLIGEAETEIISSDRYIIPMESNYTFIYLLGKTGIIPAVILVLAIILTSIKLIINAKNIKEQYGKFLIIGLSTLYILQSVASVLMNINLGIQADINIPFVSYGGFYFMVNILSMALMFSVYRRKDINFEEPKKLKKPKILTKIENCFFEEC